MSPTADPPIDPAAPPRRTRSSGNGGGSHPTSYLTEEDRTVPVESELQNDLGSDLSRSDSSGFPLPSGGDDLILQEIDRLREELASRSAAAGPPPATTSTPAWDESTLATELNGPAEAVSSPYLEERLSVARSLASDLAIEAGNVERGMQGLRKALETMDKELGRANEEIEFISNRSREREGPTSPSTARIDPRSLDSVRPGTPPATGSFGDFSVARYNRTVADLHARRRATLWVVLVLAAAISGALLFLTLRAREPVPAVWLAVLPLVWMIPVPFFVVAFRGTHRVLREHPLELPEDP